MSDTTSKKKGTWMLAMVAVLAGCGPQGSEGDAETFDTDTETENTNTGSNELPGKTSALAITAAHKLPTIISFAGYQGRSLVAGGIYTATVMSGMAGYGVVTTGTLTQTYPGVLQFSYSPQPQDKMVILLKDGKRHELTITNVQGNLYAGSPEAFLSANHALAYRHVIPGQADLQVETTNVNGQWTSSAKGTFQLDGKEYSTDLQSFGTYHFSNDMSGTESKTSYTLRGKLSTAGFGIEIDETHFFHLISSKRGSATHSIDTNNNTLVIGDDRYKWVGCSTTKVFRDGKPSVNDPWQASGTVLRNGQVFGSYRYVEQLMTSNGAQRQFQLVTPEGTVVLESWNEYFNN